MRTIITPSISYGVMINTPVLLTSFTWKSTSIAKSYFLLLHACYYKNKKIKKKCGNGHDLWHCRRCQRKLFSLSKPFASWADGDPLTDADIAVHGEALADSSKYAPRRCQVGRKVVWLPVKEHEGPAGQGRGETRAVIKSSRQCPGSQPNA